MQDNVLSDLFQEKTQSSLPILSLITHRIWLVFALLIAKDPSFLLAYIAKTDQTS